MRVSAAQLCLLGSAYPADPCALPLQCLCVGELFPVRSVSGFTLPLCLCSTNFPASFSSPACPSGLRCGFFRPGLFLHVLCACLPCLLRSCCPRDFFVFPVLSLAVPELPASMPPCSWPCPWRCSTSLPRLSPGGSQSSRFFFLVLRFLFGSRCFAASVARSAALSLRFRPARRSTPSLLPSFVLVRTVRSQVFLISPSAAVCLPLLVLSSSALSSLGGLSIEIAFSGLLVGSVLMFTLLVPCVLWLVSLLLSRSFLPEFLGLGIRALVPLLPPFLVPFV